MFARFDPGLFWNTIFDKGLLALVVLAAAHFGNRYLERYRSERALVNEAAKLRLARIGALWEELNLWERDSGRLFIEFCGTTLAELRAANVPGVPARTEEAERPVQVVMSFQNVEIPPEVGDRLATQFGPLAKQLAERAQEIARQIDRNRFWLGGNVYEAMRQYHLQMQKTMVLLAPNPEAMAEFRVANRALNAARDDLDRVLQRLLKSDVGTSAPAV